MTVHSTAIIEEGAWIGENVSIGPYCHISASAVIKAGAQLDSFVRVMDGVTIGERCYVGASAVLGGAPQIFPYTDEPSFVEIGDDCVIREHVAIHRGSTRGHKKTVIGNSCYIMDSAHIGHDSQVSAKCILARGATLGGHCELGEGVYVGGLTAVHQWVRIGKGAFIGGVVPLTRDVIPYALVNGNPAILEGLNLTGFKRRGRERKEIAAIREAFNAIFLKTGGSIKDRTKILQAEKSNLSEVAEIVQFILEPSKRGLCAMK